MSGGRATDGGPSGEYQVSRSFYLTLFASLSIILALTPIGVSGNTGRGQLLVSVNVIRECSIAMQDLDIGRSASSQSTAMARGIVALNCSRDTGYDVNLNPGFNSPGIAIPASISGVGNGATQLISVYSRVPTRVSETHNVGVGILTLTITY
jgi:spore coat protein U-like protein